ncbi:MAG: Lrp/AsnC family transcriptional regulator [Candidatus Promineifilaceae bacterium]|nr:Lrp/AsnC family transcriptional regulator [Candidatus Promineifilaceae bacterium]
MLDPIDRQLLTLLQQDARLSNAELGQRVGLTASSVYQRVKKLQQQGIIKGYIAAVDPVALGKPITAFIRLTVGASADQPYAAAKEAFVRGCLAEPDILECHGVAGEDCYVLKVRVADPLQLESLLDRLRSKAMIDNTVSSIVLSTVKETTRVEPADQ